MQITDENDFAKLREQVKIWKKRFPMFSHDVKRIESIIETHITNHSIALVFYRQSRQRKYLEDAEKEIQAINQTVALIEKIELMALLSQG